jgi:tryptophanyl-tRNA synthetase
MYTDPTHIRVTDPGRVEGNVVFIYLDAFCAPVHFEKYLPEYRNLEELKAHYRRGGLGDVKIKNFLFAVLDEILAPMRARRAKYEKNRAAVMKMLSAGTAAGIAKTNTVLQRVRAAMGLATPNLPY